MRMRTQRILAALLSLMLLLALAPAGWADGETDEIPEFLSRRNTVIINLTPSTDEDFNNDIITAGVQADLYLLTEAEPVKGYDTYKYKNLAGDLSVLQTELDTALKIDPSEYPEQIKDPAFRMSKMLESFTPLAYKFADRVLADDFEAVEPQSFVAGDKPNTITAENLKAGLYLLVLRGSNLTDKHLTLTVDGIEEEYGYVTSTKKQLSPNDTKGKEGEAHIATRAFSEKYEYLFEPQLITVPTRTDNGNLQYNTAFGDWDNIIKVNIKAARDERPGKIKIKKTLSDYLDLGKDETFEPAIFTFDIIARKTKDATSETVYRRQVSMNFDGPDTTGKTEVLKDIPAGSWVWITEIYAGAHYTGSSSSEYPIEVKADEITVVNGKTAIKEQSGNTAVFDNKNNDTHRGGHGIENVFTHDGRTWSNGWTTEPANAANGGAV